MCFRRFRMCFGHFRVCFARSRMCLNAFGSVLDSFVVFWALSCIFCVGSPSCGRLRRPWFPWGRRSFVTVAVSDIASFGFSYLFGGVGLPSVYRSGHPGSRPSLQVVFFVGISLFRVG